MKNLTITQLLIIFVSTRRFEKWSHFLFSVKKGDEKEEMVVAKPEDAKASTEEKAEAPVEQKADAKVWKVTKQDKESGKSAAI